MQSLNQDFHITPIFMNCKYEKGLQVPQPVRKKLNFPIS